MTENTMDPDLTAQEQSGLGPYCLHYRLPNIYEQMTKQIAVVVNGRKYSYSNFSSPET